MSLSLTEIQRRRAELVERARAERVAVRAVLDGHSNLFWLVDRGVEKCSTSMPLGIIA